MGYLPKYSSLVFYNMMITLFLVGCMTNIKKSKIDNNKKIENKHSDVTIVEIQKDTTKGFFLYRIYDNLEWGYMNEYGKIIIKPKYQYVQHFSDQLAVVKLNNKFGYINQSDSLIIPLVYDDADSFNDGLACVAKKIKGNYLYGFIDDKGEEIISIKYLGISEFSDQLVKSFDNDSVYIINSKGNVIYKDISKGAFSSQIGDLRDSLIIVRRNNKYGYLNREGEFVIQPIYDLALPFSESIASVKINNKFGFINLKGQYVIPPKYDLAFTFKEGLSTVCINNKCGIINNKEDIIVPLIYSNISTFKNGYAKAKIVVNENFYKTILINRLGKVVLDSSYIDLGEVDAYGTLTYSRKNLLSNNIVFGYIDTLGRSLIDKEFEFAGDFRGKYAFVKDAGKYGVINRNGEYILNPQYENIEIFNNGLATAYIKKVINEKEIPKNSVLLFEYIDESGNVIKWW